VIMMERKKRARCRAASVKQSGRLLPNLGEGRDLAATARALQILAVSG